MRLTCSLAALLLVVPLVAHADPMPTLVKRWGSFGTGPGQFSNPFGIAIDASDVIYVTDEGNNRIQKFTTDGTYLGQWGRFPDLFNPTGIAIAPNGNVYIADHQNHRVSVWTPSGTLLHILPYGFSFPVGVDVDEAGNIYVADHYETYKFSPQEQLIWERTTNVGYGVMSDRGFVYASECDGNRIVKYTTDGDVVTSWGGSTVAGAFYCPEGTVADATGNLWICDTGNDRVQKFTPDRTFLGQFIITTSHFPDRPVPSDIAIDSHGDFYVVKWNNHQIEKWAAPDQAPDCSQAHAVTESLWPPDHRMVPVTIAGVTDSDGDPVTIRVTAVTQDEPLSDASDEDEQSGIATPLSSGGGGIEPEAPQGHSSQCIDAQIHDDGSVNVRRERGGSGNGRVYRIVFTADDGRGGSCQGAITVCVPRTLPGGCVDDGQTVNSLGPCPLLGGSTTAAPEFVRVTQSSDRISLEYHATGPQVRLVVFDLAGRHIATLASGEHSAEAHVADWNTAGVSRGVYFCRLMGDGGTSTKTLIVR